MLSHWSFYLYHSLININTLGGHTIVIATLKSLSSILKASKNPVTANLELQYGTLYGNPTSPESEETTNIYPDDFLKYGKAYLVQYTYP